VTVGPYFMVLYNCLKYKGERFTRKDKLVEPV